MTVADRGAWLSRPSSPKTSSGPELPQDARCALPVLLADGEGPGLDDEEAVGRLALANDHLAGRHRDGSHLSEGGLESGWRDAGEQRQPGDARDRLLERTRSPRHRTAQQTEGHDAAHEDRRTRDPERLERPDVDDEDGDQERTGGARRPC